MKPALASTSGQAATHADAGLCRTPLRRALLLLFALVSMFGCTIPEEPTLTCPPESSPNIRVMTFNTFLTVAPASDTDSAFGMEIRERATAIAKKILEEKPEVVIFNEANHDGAREDLKRVLSTYYRSYIYELDEHDTDNDSGLMLFSRYRFTTLDQYYPPPDDDFYRAHNGGVSYHVNWRVYPSSMTNGDDAWANKGVALVRILNECDGNRPFSVAFTHAQSTGSEDDDECTQGEDMQDRSQQMAHIRGLLEQSLSTTHLLQEPVFLTGDLNIDGNQVGANIVGFGWRGIVRITPDVQVPVV